MKFGDKLIALRKKHGLSQEELAAKLNVSRQSVSKWESNNTYPETDKIIQICNIFDCSMDDLINDNITDLATIERKSKNNWNIVWDSLLEFISKTINLFSSMKFSSGLRCLIEMALIILIIAVSGIIITNILSYIVSSLVSFLPHSAHQIFTAITNSIFELLWFILTVIIAVHIFKIRYLDYYDQLTQKEENKEEEIDKKIQESKKKREGLKLKKEPNIIIRDPKHQPFAFLSVLSKIIIWFVKAFMIFMAMGFTLTLGLSVIVIVISLFLSKYSLIFIGVDISMIGAIILNVLILLAIIYFVINKKVPIKIFTILFFTSIFLCGIGIGVSLIGLKDIEIKEDVSDIIQSKTFENHLLYEENMFFTNHYIHEYNYIIDNSIAENDIIINIDYDPRFTKIGHVISDEYGMVNYNFYYQSKSNIKDIYQMIIKDLKNNILRDYNFLYADTMTIKASQETINKLMSNLSKVYLYDQKKIENGYQITELSFKIRVYDNECNGEYNAVTDTITCLEEDCVCSKESMETSKGTIIQYSCWYDDINETMEEEA